MNKKDSNKEIVTRELLDSAVDTILIGMENMIKDQDERNAKIYSTKKDVNEIKSKVDNLETKIDNLDTKIDFVRDDMKGLTAKAATNPTRRNLMN